MTKLAVGIASLVFLTPAVAGAVDVPRSFDEPPRGAGAPRSPAGERAQRAPRPPNAYEGIEVSANLGTGFSSTYGLGVGGRVGWAFPSGAYLGGAIQYFDGHNVNDETARATFFGAEAAYKFFIQRRWEVRPYVFGGPAFITEVNEVAGNTVKESKTSFAVQPGLIGAYHFGPAFVYADAKYLVTPTPTTFALSGGAGLGF